MIDTENPDTIDAAIIEAFKDVPAVKEKTQEERLADHILAKYGIGVDPEEPKPKEKSKKAFELSDEEIDSIGEDQEEEPEEKPKKKLPEKTTARSKADKAEEMSLDYALDMYDAVKKLREGKSLAEMAKKNPLLAAQLAKDLTYITKTLLSITIAKIKLEETRLQREMMKGEGGNGGGSQTIFILQGRDLPVTNSNTIEISSTPENFEMIGRDS
jgi:hypothetical protein